MITQTEIKKAVNEVLDTFEGIKVYGNDVKEGFEKPGFFVELTGSTGQNTANFIKSNYTIKITYFQKEKNEQDNLSMATKLFEALSPILKIKDRRITTNDIAVDFVGQEKSIVQVSFDISFYERIKKQEKETAKEIFTRIKTEV